VYIELSITTSLFPASCTRSCWCI